MKNKLILNNGSALFYQICSIISGLILPRLILINFGSEINGLINSITQMLAFITLLDLGVGSVIQTAFYKPLLNNDYKMINEIFSDATKYFKYIAYILIGYIIILILYYGYIDKNNFSFTFTTFLILAISISSFTQYYFGICNTILLNADQRSFIPTIINIITLLINTVMTIILMYLNINIQLIKFVSSLIFIFRPICLKLYIKKKYPFLKNEKNGEYKLANKWNGMLQHFSTVINNSIVPILLTIFSSYSVISVFNIYMLPITSIKSLLESLCTGYKSHFGQLYASKQINKLYNEFIIYEQLTHFLSIIVFSSLFYTLVPFVKFYTKDITDTNYVYYLFSNLLSLSIVIYALRLPYTTLIFSAGKFKETQFYCLIECLLNIFISIYAINKFGLNGAVSGTIISVSYRVFASVYYISKDIIYKKINEFIKQIIMDVVCCIIIIILCSFIRVNEITLYNVFIYIFKIGFISFIVTFIIFFISFREFRNFLKKKFNF